MSVLLGDQHLLSSDAFAALIAETRWDATYLSDGTVAVITGQSGYGSHSIFTYDAANQTVQEIAQIAPAASNLRLEDLSLTATADGGFFLSGWRTTGINHTVDGEIFVQRYTAAGTPLGAELVLDRGFVEDTKGIALPDGGMMLYLRHRKNPDGSVPQDEYKIVFVGADGTKGRTIEAGSEKPEGLVLDNGNIALAVSYSTGIQFQLHKPNGRAIGDPVIVSDSAGIGSNADGARIVGTDDGFAIGYTKQPRYDQPVSYQDQSQRIYVQNYNQKGKAIGPEIVIHTETDASNKRRDFDIAYSPEGLLFVAWTGKNMIATGYNAYTDVFFAVYSPKGNEIIAPMLASETVGYSQLGVRFIDGPDGKVKMIFHDGEPVQFGHQDAIMGRDLLDPDSFWEGTGKTNVKIGTDGSDIMLGLGGADTVSGGNKNDYIRGGNGDDVLNGDKGSDVLLGEAGHDRLDGGAGDDDARGGAGDDSILGGNGDDTGYGGYGNDRFYGGNGDDYFYSGAGRDLARGGDGNDTLDAHGSTGRKTFKGDAGDDALRGGAANDRLFGGSESDVLNGNDGKDRLFGGDGLYDVLYGGAGNDRLKGDGGIDLLVGGEGNDRVWGGSGNDTISGGRGDDKFHGGADADTFLFSTTDFGADVILDFEFGIDTLDMRNVANTLQNDGSGRQITVTDTAEGVVFGIDAVTSVLVRDADLSDFQTGDYLIEPY